MKKYRRIKTPISRRPAKGKPDAFFNKPPKFTNRLVSFDTILCSDPGSGFGFFTILAVSLFFRLLGGASIILQRPSKSAPSSITNWYVEISPLRLLPRSNAVLFSEKIQKNHFAISAENCLTVLRYILFSYESHRLR